MGDHGTASATRRSRNPLAYAFAKYVSTGTVTEVEPVTRTIRRIRIVTDSPDPLPYTPGQHVRIQLNDPLSLSGLLRPAETLRSYTIWTYSVAERALELRAHLYNGDGIGVSWARTVCAGDPVTFWGPMGDFTLREAPYHLFIGEETATCAFGPMIRALGPDARVYALLESESAEDELPLPGPHRPLRVHRRGAPAVCSPTLLAALPALDLPHQPGAAYVAGEARTCQRVRDHLVRDRGWPRGAIVVKPFWTPGKRGLH
jgi:NADPH-dependent ferric siderophore reductase